MLVRPETAQEHMTEVKELLIKAGAKLSSLRIQTSEFREFKDLSSLISKSVDEADHAQGLFDEFCEDQKTFDREFTLYIQTEEMTVGSFWVSGVLHEAKNSVGRRNVASEVLFNLEGITAWAHDKARELNGKVVRITDAAIGDLSDDLCFRNAIAMSVAGIAS